ncbi:MAG: hypothetical protein ACRDB0_07035 [Paraclostridium sp.]
MQVTSLEQLKQIKQYEVIELPPFNDGTPFIAEVKRPNLMNLVASKKIPNTLLSSAMSIFKGGVGGAATEAMEDAKALAELAGLMNVLAENTLVNPSCKDLKEANIELTEAQLVDIMNYMQGGVKALSTFRNE